MPRSGHIAELRRVVGHRRLLVPAVTLAIFDDRDRVLLVRHDDGGIWALPSGGIEPSETPADAAVREAREELGIEIEPTRVVGVYGGPAVEVRYDNGDVTAHVSVLFDCRVRGGALEPDGVEIDRLRFVTEDDWRGDDTAGWLDHVMPDVFEHRRMGGDAPARFAARTWPPI